MSLRARVIQRKRIHSLSTGVVPLALAVALAACAGGGAGKNPAGDRVLLADPAIINIPPNGTGSARFVLTSGGVPIAGQRVSISIVDSPTTSEDDAKGATLADSSAVTDISGVAAVDVQAGDATVLNIRAIAESAPPAALKIVVALGTGSVMVTPTFAPDSDSTGTTGFDVRLMNQACAMINAAARPEAQDTTMHLPMSGTPALFPLVTTADPHAAVARAVDMNDAAIAAGCVDLPPGSIVTDSVVQVWLPLHDAVPNPIGSYAVKSSFDFDPPLAAAAAIAAPWRDLGDCPLDPAQLFLDCIVDAMSPETADDPLDCKPNVTPGGEGAMGDLFMARRGVPIVDGTGTATACRGAIDAAGAPSLDAIAMGLFGTPTPALIVALPTIGEEAAHVLDSVVLNSTLTIDPAGLPNQYLVTHRLDSATFGPQQVLVPLVPLALPVLTAHTSASTADGPLSIAQHGFSLRLGRVARAGFAGLSLAPRGVQSGVGGMVVEIASRARSEDGAVSGCAAFDRALCAAVGAEPGCLARSCPPGLSTLATRLDSVFDTADGTGLDFYMSGSAQVIDMHDSGTASRLGADQKGTASWTIDVRTAAGRARVIASFDAPRN